jgi:thiamine kinase-like enzyme
MNKLKVLMEVELEGLDFIQSGFQLKPFNGGTINSSYLLETSNRNYFVKTFESDKIALLDRQRLFDIQLELANKGVAVKPVYLSKCCQFQIDQWIDIPTLDQVVVSNLAVAKSLAFALSLVHKTQINCPKLDLPRQWQHYMSLMKEPVLASEQLTLDRYADIWYQACEDESVFCHNDLSISHVTNTQPCRIFDWEYCAISSPYFDLASCIAVNGLSSTDEASLCALYAQYTDKRLSDVIDKVTVMKPLVELTNRLWYAAARESN